MKFSKGMLTLRFWREHIYKHRRKLFIWLTNKTVRQQEKDSLSIPVIIINFNRLKYLKELVNALVKLNHSRIIIIDNNSTYQPLLDYYEKIRHLVTVEIMTKNYGHLVFWENKELFNKYSNGYYIVTDSDIIPNKHLPFDYVEYLKKILDKNKKINKVGFSLDIENIPNCYNAKRKVIAWEAQFWENKIGNDLYKADIDTTFALYPPRYYPISKELFFEAVRIAGNFTAKHGGWYIDQNNLSEEDKYYFMNANKKFSSWSLDEYGQFAGHDKYNKK